MLAIIPARYGSKGIPYKNIYPLCGKPLIDWTIEAIRSTPIEYYISTDIDWICKNYNVLKRPEHLCTDNSPIIDTLKYIIGDRKEKDIMLLQPTSPLRTITDIHNALKLYHASKADSLYSGYYLKLKHKQTVYDKYNNKPHFQRNGAIFIAKRELIEQGKLWSDNVFEFEMPEARSIDIDTMEDMRMAEYLIKGGVLDGVF